ncbi:hypothetical protein SAMN02745134_02580 [Clostridium acidisoli DSM 12555]|uniref:ECF transporter S component n=1 Tax=Clostridium acidisoli DSM 12555 TaxID=1121291 RepID=A0A1W1XP82_9CLOT|nr:ECF transporter S component [Clostridium acidisoli]SMC25800.1 hypothetical protein SAMN02745134_02580 [Clostridium acidisoli DSM 12555]
MNNNLKNLVRAALFLAIAIIFQFLGKAYPQVSQIFVGPAVNAVLIITASICGLYLGLAVGALTPLLAWTLGQLPAPFGPFIPFIIIGNWLFIILYYNCNKFKKYGAIIGIILGSILKFLFLFLSATKLIVFLKLISNPKIVSKLSVSMGVLQLITALVGGFIALVLLNLLIRRKQI